MSKEYAERMTQKSEKNGKKKDREKQAQSVTKQIPQWQKDRWQKQTVSGAGEILHNAVKGYQKAESQQKTAQRNYQDSAFVARNSSDDTAKTRYAQATGRYVASADKVRRYAVSASAAWDDYQKQKKKEAQRSSYDARYAARQWVTENQTDAGYYIDKIDYAMGQNDYVAAKNWMDRMVQAPLTAQSRQKATDYLTGIYAMGGALHNGEDATTGSAKRAALNILDYYGRDARQFADMITSDEGKQWTDEVSRAYGIDYDTDAMKDPTAYIAALEGAVYRDNSTAEQNNSEAYSYLIGAEQDYKNRNATTAFFQRASEQTKRASEHETSRAQMDSYTRAQMAYYLLDKLANNALGIEGNFTSPEALDSETVEYARKALAQYGVQLPELTEDNYRQVLNRAMEEQSRKAKTMGGVLEAQGYDIDAVRQANEYLFDQQFENDRKDSFTKWAKNANAWDKAAASVLSAAEASYLDWVLSLYTFSKLVSGHGNADDPNNYQPMVGTTPTADLVDSSISGEMKPVWAFIYNTGMSVADSAVRNLSFGKVGSLVSMGLSAAGSSANEILERGGSPDQAAVGGAAAGMIEVLTEKVSIDRLFDKVMKGGQSAREFLYNAVMQAIPEASEEVASDVLNLLVDSANMGSQSEFNQKKFTYMESGMTEDEALKKTWVDQIKDMAMSGLAGGLSGLVSGVAFGSAARYSDTRQIKAMAQEAEVYARQAEAAGKQEEAAKYWDVSAQYRELLLQRRAEWTGKQPTAPSQLQQIYDASTLKDAQSAYEEAEAAGGKKEYSKAAAMQAVEKTAASLFADAKDLDSLDAVYEAQTSGLKNDTVKAAAKSAYLTAALKLTGGNGVTRIDGISHALAKLGGAQKNSVSQNATVTQTGEQAKVVGLEDNGSVRVQTSQNGNQTVKTVSAEDLKADSPEMARAIRNARFIGGKDGNLFLQSFLSAASSDPEFDGYAFQTDYLTAYGWGKSGSRTLEQTKTQLSLDPQIAQWAYEAGQRADERHYQSAQKVLDAVKRTISYKEKGASGKRGSVDASEIEGIRLNKTQQAQVRLAGELAKRLGVRVEFYDSGYTGAQGSYQSGVIRLDIRAGQNSSTQKTVKGAILMTMSHELTHFISQYSPELYRELKTFTAQKLGAKAIGSGNAWDTLIYRKQRRAKDAGYSISETDAAEEVIADACELMLRDSAFIKDLLRENRTLGEKVRDFVTEFLHALTGAKAMHEEARILDEVAGQMAQMWDAALRDAVQTHDAVAEKNTAETGGGEKYSIRPDLKEDLKRIQKGTFPANSQEVLIGDTSDFLVDEIGAKPLPFYMPAVKAYRAIATEAEAKAAGMPTGKSIHYHGLGVDGLLMALEKAEHPIAAYASYSSKENENWCRIVLVTDEKVGDGLCVVIVEPNTKAFDNNIQVYANKTISVYEKQSAVSLVQEAYENERLLYIDKKSGHIFDAGRKGSNSPTTMRESVRMSSIRNFWGNVNWKNLKNSNNFYTAGNDAPNSALAEQLKAWQGQKSEREYGVDELDVILQAHAEDDPTQPGQAELLEQAQQNARELKWMQNRLARLTDLGKTGVTGYTKEELQARLRTAQEELAAARRELTRTDRRVSTKGIDTFSRELLKNYGNAYNKNAVADFSHRLQTLYQDTLDLIDAGETQESARLFSAQVDLLAQELLQKATVRDYGKHRPWTQTIARTEEAQQEVMEGIAGQIVTDFLQNRSRAAISPTEMDRAIEALTAEFDMKLWQANEKALELRQKLKQAKQEAFETAEVLDTQKEILGEQAKQLYDQKKTIESQKADAALLQAWEQARQKHEQGEKARQAAQMQKTISGLEKKLSNTKDKLAMQQADAALLRAWEQARQKHLTQEISKLRKMLETRERWLKNQIAREGAILSGQIENPKIKSRIAEARRQAEAAMQEKKNRQFAAYKEGKEKTELRNRIKDVADSLKRRVTDPSDRTYVPVGLVQSILDLSETLSYAPKDGTKAKAKYDSVNQAVRALAEEYKKLETDEDYTFASEYDAQLSAELQDMASVFEQKQQEFGREVSLRDMSKEELQHIYENVKTIQQTLRDATKVLNHTEFQSVQDAVISVMEQQRKLAEKNRDRDGKKERLLDHLSVMRAVEMMSGWDENATLYRLFADLEHGASEANGYRMRYNKLLEPLKTGKNEKNYLDALTRRVDFGIRDENGDPVPMTHLQAVQIVMTWNRESASGGKLVHLQKGGAYIRNAIQIQDGKIKEADRQRISVTPEIVEQIEGKLTQWDKAYMHTIRQYFNDTEAQAVNPVYNKLKHRLLKMEKDYVPETVAKDYLEAKLSAEEAFQIWVKQPGSTNALKTKAPQPVIIDGMETIMQSHVSEIADYVSLAIPVRNFAKVFNGKVSRDGDVYLKLETVLQDNFKQKGTDLLKNAVRDLQGGIKSNGWETNMQHYMQQLQSAFVNTALLLNPSVTMKQAASYASAMSVLSYKALLAGNRPMFASTDKSHSPTLIAQLFAAPDGKTARRLYAEIDAHTSEHYIRRLGMSQEEIANEKLRTSGLKRAINQIGASMEKNVAASAVRKAASWANPINWIQRMDVATTAALWVAAKEQAKINGFATGTQEFWDETTRLYEKTIRQTQPMYDSLHRAAIQKTDGISKYLFPFRTVPIQNHGQIVAAYETMLAQKHGTKAQKADAQKHFIKTIWANMESAVVFSLLTAVAAGLKRKTKKYRDEDGELSWSRFLAGVGGDVLSVWASNFMPQYGSEIYGWMEKGLEKLMGKSGYTYDAFTIGAVDLLNDIYENSLNLIGDLGKLQRGEEVKPEALKEDLMEMLLSGLKMFGIPASTVSSYLDGAIKNIQDIKNGRFPAWNNAEYRTTMAYLYELIDANKDFGTAKQAVIDAGKNPETVDSEIRKYLREQFESGAYSEEKYRNYLSRYCGITKTDTVNKMVRESRCFMETGIRYDKLKESFQNGVITEEEAVKFVEQYGGKSSDDAYWTVQKWAALESHMEDEEYSYSKYENLHQAVDSFGSIDQAVKELLSHGVKEQSVYSNIKTYCKDQYISGVYSEAEFRERLKKYCDVTDSDDLDEYVDAASFAKEYPDYDISASQAHRFYTQIAPAGISAAQYVSFLDAMSNCKGTDLDNDGKTDSGSLKAAKMAKIDAMNLTSAQKDVLYLAEGMSASTISDAPWH